MPNQAHQHIHQPHGHKGQDVAYVGVGKHGGSVAKKRGRPPGFADKQRTAEIIKMREGKSTYQEIGARFGISKERVRQILHKAGRSDLCHRKWNNRSHCGPYKPRIEKECAQCGKTMLLIPSRSGRIYCSRKCYGLLERQRDKLVVILGDRISGMSWTEVAKKHGYVNPTSPRSVITILAKRSGLDISWLNKGRWDTSPIVPPDGWEDLIINA